MSAWQNKPENSTVASKDKGQMMNANNSYHNKRVRFLIFKEIPEISQKRASNAIEIWAKAINQKMTI